MIDSYAKVALRNLTNQKIYSCINIAGLAVGICCFILIMLFVRHELSYDLSFSKTERIYRISQNLYPPDGTSPIFLAANSPQVAPLLQAEQAQVEAATRLLSVQTKIHNGNGEPLEQQAALVDANFVEVFDLHWLAGEPARALTDPSSVVLTASMARRLFGSDEALGKMVELDIGNTALVSGVIADMPANTHLSFDLLLPISLSTSLLGPNVFDNWNAQSFHTYVLLHEGATIQTLSDQFPDFVERHVGEGDSRIMVFDATPISDIHLHSTRRNELKTPGSMMTVQVFIAIAVVVLMVACINFMNLATVRATQRAREVGVRKAIGASKQQVMVQFLGEAMLLVSLSLLLGLMLVEMVLPFFNALVQQNLVFDLLSNLGMLSIILVVVALVSGSYPAFYLASFNTTSVLRGKAAAGAGGQWLRKLLVVFQFSIAVALLIATWIIHSQLEFARNIDTGYDKEQVLVVNTGTEGVGRGWDLLKQQLLASPDVVTVSASNSQPSAVVGSSYYFNYEGGSEPRTMPTMLVDFDYFATYNIPLLAGRAYSREYGTDLRSGTGQLESSYIINELAARQLGWTAQQALGKSIEMTCCGIGKGTIVGVVGNVHYGSAQQPLGPVAYIIPPEPVERIHSETRLGLKQASIKLSGNNVEDTLAYIDDVWQEQRPGQLISGFFLDEELAGLYRNEERQEQMLGAFALLAIIITCMGLYGLSSFNALLRTKEIGVRKVMGGSVWSIVLLLTNDFSKLVLVSNLLAWPIAYFAMNRWLENFAYRIDLTPLVFVGSGLIALCIAWVTVGGTAAKAASAKPVLALRYE